jgi:hypothetical protein
MIHDEKGASKIENEIPSIRDDKLSNISKDEEIEKRKNGIIYESVYLNNGTTKEFSSKKRLRTNEKNDDDNHDRNDISKNKNLRESKQFLINLEPQIINLLDVDVSINQNTFNNKIKCNNINGSPLKKKHIKLKNSTESKTKGSPAKSIDSIAASLSVSPSENKTRGGKMNRDSCSICRDGGELILCDRCPKSFHVDCLKIKDIPEGSWYCPGCL